MYCSKLGIFHAPVGLHPKIGGFLMSTSAALSRASAVKGVQQPQQGEQSISALGHIRREKERRDRIMSISDSMKTYLVTVMENRELLEEEKFAYRQGKRHLANMMGLDPETISEARNIFCFILKN